MPLHMLKDLMSSSSPALFRSLACQAAQLLAKILPTMSIRLEVEADCVCWVKPSAGMFAMAASRPTLSPNPGPRTPDE